MKREKILLCYEAIRQHKDINPRFLIFEHLDLMKGY